jgi:hypothetical protein
MAAHGARGHDIGKRWTLGAAMRREVFGQAQVKRKRGREGRKRARGKEEMTRGRKETTRGKEDARRKEVITNVSPSKVEGRCTLGAAMKKEEKRRGVENIC